MGVIGKVVKKPVSTPSQAKVDNDEKKGINKKIAIVVAKVKIAEDAAEAKIAKAAKVKTDKEAAIVKIAKEAAEAKIAKAAKVKTDKEAAEAKIAKAAKVKIAKAAKVKTDKEPLDWQVMALADSERRSDRVEIAK